jgi:carboxylesterase
MRPLATVIANAGFSVLLPRLPGHGTSVEDMKTTTWADWSAAALAAYDELRAKTDRVAVVGLSMGGGLTAFVNEHRTDVTGNVFINPLVKPLPQELRDGLQALIDEGVDELESIGSDIKKADTLEASYNATPLSCVQSLFVGIDDVHAHLAKISAPSLLLSSREDHVVSSDNGDDLMAMVSGPIERIWLEDSYHVATMDNDASLVEAETLAFLIRAFAS